MVTGQPVDSQRNDAQASTTKIVRAAWKRWTRWLVVLVVMLASALVAVPWAVGYYVSRHLSTLLRPYVAGNVEVARVSIGWLRPLRLEGVQLWSNQEETQRQPGVQYNLLGTVDLIETSTSIWTFLLQPTQWGTVRVHGVKAVCVCEPGGSNWERFLEPLWKRPPSDRPLAVQWEVHDFHLSIQALDESPIECRFPLLTGKWQRGSSQEVLLKAEGYVPNHSGQGRIALWLDVATAGAHQSDHNVPTPQPIEMPSANDGLPQCVVEWQEVPAELLQAVAVRLGKPWSVTGTVSGKMEGRLHPQVQWQWRDVRLTDMALEAADVVAETIRCDQLASDGSLSVQGDTWNVHVAAEGDFGRLQFTAEQWRVQDTWTDMRWLAGSRLSVRAEVDVAKLAEKMPTTFRVHDELTIDSAPVQVVLEADGNASPTRLHVVFESRDWTARWRGQRVVWQQPLLAKLTAQFATDRWQVEEIDCQSEFLTVEWHRETAPLHVRIVGDLDRLDARLHQFFDWPYRFAGAVEGSLTCQRHEQQIQVAAKLSVTNGSVQRNGQMLWSEPQSLAELTFSVQPGSDASTAKLLSAEWLWTAGEDYCRGALVEPVDLRRIGLGRWKWELGGDLHRWDRRLAAIVSSRLGGRMEGRFQAAGEWQWSQEGLQVTALQGRLERCALRWPEWQVADAQIDVAADQVRTRSSAHGVSYSVEGFRWQGTSLAVHVPQLSLEWPPSTTGSSAPAPQMDGSVEFAADAGKLFAAAFTHSSSLSAREFGGQLRGRLKLGAVSSLEADITDLQVSQTRYVTTVGPVASPSGAVPATTVLWHDPRVQVRAQLQWSPGPRWAANQFAISGGGWSITGTGAIDAAPPAIRIHAQGNMIYDWQELHGRSPLLAGSRIRIYGKHSAPFAVSGPLWEPNDMSVWPPSSLQASVSVGWQKIEVSGFVVGAGESAVVLQNAVLHVSVDETPVSGGVLRLHSAVDLHQPRPVVVVAPGRVLDHVELTPEMCRGWLKYIHPIVAGATRAQGTFGIDIEHGAIPLDAFHDAQITGALQLQQGSVGAGPLTQEVISLVERIAALVERRLPRLSALAREQWIEMPAQTVVFRIQQQQVAHQGLQMWVRDIPLTTQGTVGFDQSLQLDIDLTIPERWTENRPLLARLRGRPLRIPVRGTLTRPELDEKFFAELARQLVGGAAGQLLEEGLLRGLDRLLKDR